MRCFLVVLALALCASCSRGKPKETPPSEATPVLRLALVTDLKGYLEPCGCTSRPLGGIDRLAAQLRVLRESSAPVVVLMAGDLFFDTSELEPKRVDQANRNATTLRGILDSLNVTAVLPGRRDRAQPPDAIAKLRQASGFPWLSMNSQAEVSRIEVGGLRLALVGVPPDVEHHVVLAAVGTAHAETDLTIALMDGSRKDANRVGAIDGVDFVIQGGLDEDAPLPPRPAGEAWVFHAGRQGQGLTIVEVYRNDDGPFADRSEWSRTERIGQLDRQIKDLSAKIATWESSKNVDPSDVQTQRDRLAQLERERADLQAPAPPVEGNAFSARWFELPKEAPRDPQIEKLMREHDSAVNEANRIAFADLQPPPLGPNDIAYVGSKACASCHEEAYMWWRSNAHGVAYLTLQQRNKEYNLDCVGCHVTGYNQPGGSTVTHNMQRQLVDVGCESCHGPGAAHTADPEVDILRDTPESTCVVCHNEEHSDLFNYDAYRQLLVVPGHGLPPLER